jgi:hypothetical protein
MTPLVAEPSTSVGPDDVLDEAAEKLELVSHLADLERDGFTVVPPEKVASSGFRDLVHDRVLALHERLSRDPKRGPLLDRLEKFGAGRVMQAALLEDEVFETALLNPVVQTLARAMTGHACRISAFDAVVKPPGGPALSLHCDTEMTEPFPTAAQVCNVTYALSDYSPDLGSTTFVPGSHRLQRQPRGEETNGIFCSTTFTGALRIPEPRAVTCRAGSLIAWSGLTWHGAVPRTREGERISLIMYFCRWYLQPQQIYRNAPTTTLARTPPRFAQMLDVVPGWEVKNPLAERSRAASSRAIYPILDVDRP